MSAIATTLKAYEPLSGKLGLPALELRKVTCEAHICAKEEEVHKKIETFAPAEGWVRYQSELVAVEAGDWRPKGENPGRLLYGELANGLASLTIRPFGHGWRVVTFTEGTGNSEYLAEEVAFLRDVPGMDGHAPAADRDRLRYVVYWTVDADGCRPAFSRFTGFGKG